MRGQEGFCPLKPRQAPLYKVPLGFEIASRLLVPSDGAMKLPEPCEATNAVIQLDQEASLAVVIAGVFLVVRVLKYKVPKVHLTMPKGCKGCGAA